MSGKTTRIKIEERENGKTTHVYSMIVNMDPHDTLLCVQKGVPKMFQRPVVTRKRKSRQAAIVDQVDVQEVARD